MRVTKRIVVCVDGTWYNADGKEGNWLMSVVNFDAKLSYLQGKAKGTTATLSEYMHQLSKVLLNMRVVGSNRYDLVKPPSFFA